jgi:hypothetical protein
MRMVRVLEEDGWIRRWDSETGRRVTHVEFTVEGRERFSSVLKEAAEVWREIWSGLDLDEKNTLSRILSRLRANLLARYIGRERLLPYKLDKMQAQVDGRGYSPALRSNLYTRREPARAVAPDQVLRSLPDSSRSGGRVLGRPVCDGGLREWGMSIFTWETQC